jgi:hypothetical protein
MKRRTNAPSDEASRATVRPVLSRPVRRERAGDYREPAIDWLAADPVFQALFAARA